MVYKRDGRLVEFDASKIREACRKAGASSFTANMISNTLSEKSDDNLTVENIQDEVERELMKYEPDVARAYIRYRDKRTKMRGRDRSTLISEIVDVKNSNLARDNANMNAYTPAGMMYKFGSIIAQQYTRDNLLSEETNRAIDQNYIHIHDLDYYPMKAVNCLQHPLDRVLEGFRANHAANRSAKRIESAATMAAISLQTVQNEMFGGQAIPAFDFYLAPYVYLTYKEECEKIGIEPYPEIKDYYAETNNVGQDKALQNTVKRVYQAMEGFIHNMNDMHSRGGNQTVFSSINYGTDTSAEGRCIMKELLLSTEKGVGNGETALFPIQVFKVKAGVNLNLDDPNYDLFKMACRVTTRRFFPNFLNLDATYNQDPLWKADDPKRYLHEVATMGCRTRVYKDRFGMSTSVGRGNLSFTTLNLVRLALEAKKDCQGGEDTIDRFFDLLTHYCDLVAEQLHDRYLFQASAYKFQFPLLMDKMWNGCEELNSNDTVEEAIKHGTLAIGYIGLAEALIVLTGHHHGESDDAQQLGLDIVKYIRLRCDQYSDDYDLNYTCFATPAEGLSGKFVPKDRADFGVIEHVTDKEYYTNSNHVPVWYPCTMYKKLQIEAPYHELTNAGHIVYAEFDGDASHNPQAVEAFVKGMVQTNAGYGSINHTRGRCLDCGWETADADVNECPICGGHHIDFIQRITGRRNSQCCQ